MERSGTLLHAERRQNSAQRDAVEAVLAAAQGKTRLLRGADGSVFVYEEHRDWLPPTTLRVRVAPDGEVEAPQRFHHGA